MNATSTAASELAASDFDQHIDTLAAILHDCWAHGASIGFVAPFTPADAAQFWRKLQPAFDSGARRLFVARDAGGAIVGTVQLSLDMPPNGAHRAEINKMLVHSAARQQGHARALMLAAETCARTLGKSLLVLDTLSGGVAERLYAGLGFQMTGQIPGYARLDDGTLHATSVLYKLL